MAQAGGGRDRLGDRAGHGSAGCDGRARADSWKRERCGNGKRGICSSPGRGREPAWAWSSRTKRKGKQQLHKRRSWSCWRSEHSRLSRGAKIPPEGLWEGAHTSHTPCQQLSPSPAPHVPRETSRAAQIPKEPHWIHPQGAFIEGLGILGREFDGKPPPLWLWADWGDSAGQQSRALESPGRGRKSWNFGKGGEAGRV